MSRRIWIVLLGLFVAAVVGVAVAVKIYTSGDAPDELQLDAPTGEVFEGPVDGQWVVAGGSIARYRVDEILFGQHKTVIGETTLVSGATNIDGDTATGTTVTVDMASIRTDDGNRDSQYRGRIMSTDQFPTSTFTQTTPVDLSDLPTDGNRITIVLTGDLTLRGATQTVNVGVDLQRTASGLQARGIIPVVFGDYGIPEPSIPGISVEGHGQIEFLVNLTRQ